MPAEQGHAERQMSEEDYWARVKAYNADGSYAYPPPPINADQVFDFWMHVLVPDGVLRVVQERDEARHTEMECQLLLLHTEPYRRAVRSRVLRFRQMECLPPLSPELWQERVDTLASVRRYRKHPELLEQTREMALLRLAIEQTNALVASVPPCRIPPEQIRMAARLGALAHNAGGLQQTELAALWRFEVVFMGEPQTIRDVCDTWRPDQIAWY